MDGQTIKQNLGPETIKSDVDEKELSAAIRALTVDARNRVVFNSSGGLPGPPRMTPTVARRIADFLRTLFNH
jgi:hypothetical protein